MVFYRLKLNATVGDHRRLAPGLTLIAALTTMTPLCGYLFACGCTWPGLGLDSACNIHHSQALHQCPWCASLIAGWLSLGIALMAGIILSMHPLDSMHRKPFAWIRQTLSGLGAFVLVAWISAMISAWAQNYPM